MSKVFSIFWIFYKIQEKIIKYFIDIVKEPYRKRIENGEPLAKLTKDILDEFKIKI